MSCEEYPCRADSDLERSSHQPPAADLGMSELKKFTCHDTDAIGAAASNFGVIAGGGISAKAISAVVA